MPKLIEVASVHREGGNWTAGLEVEGLQCAMRSGVAGLCLPPSVNPLGGTTSDGGPSGYPLNVFGIVVQLVRPNMCRVTDPVKVVRDAVTSEEDKAIGRALWFGTGSATMWFGADGASSVPDPEAGVAELLQAFYRKTVGVDPVVHMGLGTAEAYSGKMVGGGLNAFPDVTVVVNSSYPFDGLAVSGPVEAWVGPVEGTQTHNIRVNREYTEATALAAVAVDPCTIVVRGDLPAQEYVGFEGNFASVRMAGVDTATTVDWGDASADDTIEPGDEVGANHTYENPGAYVITVTSETGTTTHNITVV